LTKTSATDYATNWQTPAAGGGGNVATDPIWDAKGDLAAATGADAAVKLPVGTNGQILSVDSSTATGLKWIAAPSGGGLPPVTTNGYVLTVVSGAAAWAAPTIEVEY
jgi:hypothetical protein